MRRLNDRLIMGILERHMARMYGIEDVRYAKVNDGLLITYFARPRVASCSAEWRVAFVLPRNEGGAPWRVVWDHVARELS